MVSFLLYGLLINEAFEDSSCHRYVGGGMFASLNAAADDSVFTVMDDPASAKKPFEGNLNAGYLAQSGNTKSSSLTADTTMTWYGQTTAWSLWGTPVILLLMMSVLQKNMPRAGVAVLI